MVGVTNGVLRDPKIGCGLHTTTFIRGLQIGAYLWPCKLEHYFDVLGVDVVEASAESPIGFRKLFKTYGFTEHGQGIQIYSLAASCKQMRSYEITAGASPALEVLRSGGTGRVHSVFNHTFNILLSGRLVGVLTENATLNPISVRSSIPSSMRMFDLVKKGVPVQVEGTLVTVGGVELDFQGASIWEPQVRVDLVKKEGILKNLKAVELSVAGAEGDDGFVPLLRKVDEISTGKLNSSNLGQLCRVAGPRIAKLVSKVKDGELGGIEGEIGGLIGLGPGLTPSGDDFLCGFVASVGWVTRSINMQTEILERLQGAMKNHFHNTNLLSSQLLEHAACGEVDQRVEQFLKAMLTGPGENLEYQTKRVMGIGETSGADMLLGLILGIEATLNRLSEMF